MDGSWFKVQGAGFKVRIRGSRFMVQGSGQRFRVQGSRFGSKVQRVSVSSSDEGFIARSRERCTLNLEHLCEPCTLHLAP
jgi:hypothetical protein